MVAGFVRCHYKQLVVALHDPGDPFRVVLANAIETQTFALRLALHTLPGDVFALSGELGTGKTTFARGFINGLFVSHGLPKEEIPSPTFNLVQEYTLPNYTIYHIDLYRIEHMAELSELGLEDAFTEGVTLVEWPERLGNLLPSDHLHIEFRQGKTSGVADKRDAYVSAYGSWQTRIKRDWLHGKAG